MEHVGLGILRSACACAFGEDRRSEWALLFLMVRSLLSMTWSNIALPATGSREAIALTIAWCSPAEIGISHPSARFEPAEQARSLISLR